MDYIYVCFPVHKVNSLSATVISNYPKSVRKSLQRKHTVLSPLNAPGLGLARPLGGSQWG